jgi:hypothetical protein
VENIGLQQNSASTAAHALSIQQTTFPPRSSTVIHQLCVGDVLHMQLFGKLTTFISDRVVSDNHNCRERGQFVVLCEQ